MHESKLLWSSYLFKVLIAERDLDKFCCKKEGGDQSQSQTQTILPIKHYIIHNNYIVL